MTNKQAFKDEKSPFFPLKGGLLESYLLLESENRQKSLDISTTYTAIFISRNTKALKLKLTYLYRKRLLRVWSKYPDFCICFECLINGHIPIWMFICVLTE